MQHNDKSLIKQLVLEGKIHGIDRDTKAVITDTGLIDKNAVTIVIEEGKAFCQGIVTRYYICDGAESDVQRNGGFGSTDKGER